MISGKVHAHLHQCGAGSGRFSCDSPNLQQIPREASFRRCFVPSFVSSSSEAQQQPRLKFLIADFSQIELRIAADIACDWTMIEAYRQVSCVEMSLRSDDFQWVCLLSLLLTLVLPPTNSAHQFACDFREETFTDSRLPYFLAKRSLPFQRRTGNSQRP